MKNWKKFLAGVIVGAILALAIAWAYVGNSADGQGRFKGKLTPISVIKTIKIKK